MKHFIAISGQDKLCVLVLLCIACFRLIYVFYFLHTTFIPDEYYQAYEVAYALVFNTTTQLTWEWNPPYHIRSYIPLAPYIIVFYVGKVLGIHASSWYAIGPRIAQTLICIATDAAYFQYIRESCDTSLALHALVVQSLSWSYAYLMPRALINSTDTTLTVLGLLLWHRLAPIIPISPTPSISPHPPNFPISPISPNTKYRVTILAAYVTFAIYIRPTSVFLWSAKTFLHLLSHPPHTPLANLPTLAIHIISASITMLLLCCAIDSAAYGVLVCPPASFFYYNIILSLSHMYGVQPMHWYATSGLPILLGLYTAMPVYLITHLIAKSTSIIGLSFVAHKEFRFMLPLLPGLHLLIAHMLKRLSLVLRILCLVVVGATHISAAVYLGTRHQCRKVFAHGVSESAVFESDPTAYYEQVVSPIVRSAVSRSEDVFLVTFDAYLTENLLALLYADTLRLEKVYRHADFRYDLDDPLPKQSVALFRSTSS